MKTKKRKKRDDTAWRARAGRALAAEPALRRRLAGMGLRLVVSTVRAGRTTFALLKAKLRDRVRGKTDVARKNAAACRSRT